MSRLSATLISFVAVATAANASDIYGFRGGPTYPSMQKDHFFCNEFPGDTPEQIAAKREICESSGSKWQGRLNWTAFAKNKQRELDEMSAQEKDD